MAGSVASILLLWVAALTRATSSRADAVHCRPQIRPELRGGGAPKARAVSWYEQAGDGETDEVLQVESLHDRRIHCA